MVPDKRWRHFGIFSLDLSARQLYKNCKPFPIQPRQVDILELLTSNPGHPFSRSDFKEVVWKGQQVDEGTLSVHICNIRRKLGDSAQGSLYIAKWTDGYTFVARVEETDEAVSPFVGKIELLTDEKQSRDLKRDSEQQVVTPRPFLKMPFQNSWAAVIDAWLLGGFIGGAVVGFPYYLQYQYVGFIRVGFVIAYGILDGLVFGVVTRVVLPKLDAFSKKYSLIPRNPWSQKILFWVQTLLVYTTTGIFVSPFAAMFFWSRGLGPPVSWELCMSGFLLATIVGEMGMMLYEHECSLKDLFRATGTCLGVSFLHFVIGAFVLFPFRDRLDSAFVILSMGGPPLLAGCLIGALIGGLMGSQMYVTVLSFRAWQHKLGAKCREHLIWPDQ